MLQTIVISGISAAVASFVTFNYTQQARSGYSVRIEDRVKELQQVLESRLQTSEQPHDKLLQQAKALSSSRTPQPKTRRESFFDEMDKQVRSWKAAWNEKVYQVASRIQ